MRKPLRFVFVISLFISLNAFANSTPPKREFRGAWIATVGNIDWPPKDVFNPQTQRNELIRILDELKDAGITAVFLQIRPEGDALYASTIEPWSYWLTGQQGQAPNPFYDPLEFAIDEAHKRGMELHAWFNPYWVVRNTTNHSIDPNHISIKHPEWILTFPAYPSGNQKWLDPGLPDVRSYITSVIIDVVRRYDIDGVHFDDYFYVYPDSRINLPIGITNQDDATFKNYSRGFADRRDWRRDNVNLLVKMVHDSIQAVKSDVKFGISPFGIWKDGVPAGITGMDAYNVIYADPLAWLNQRTVEYIAPQLYWPFGGGQDYGKLMPWWASQTNERHLYIGQGAYRITNWSASEMPRQLRANRNNPNAKGSIFFSAHYFGENPKGFTDSLKTDLYRYPALSPVMAWKDSVPPHAPRNLRYERIAGTGTAGLRWLTPAMAADGDTASRYVVYRFDHSPLHPNELEDPSRIVAIVGDRISMPKTPPPGTGAAYYVVTALDRNANESSFGEVLLVVPPAAPVLASPVNGASDQPPSVALRWYYPSYAASYQLQVSKDSTFATQLAVNESGIVDTFKVIAGLNGQETYYWRVRASNAGGTGAFSSPYHFTTGFPAAPMLAYPANNTPNIPVDPTLRWNLTRGASSYRLQVSRSLTFDSTAIVVDVAGIVDTSYAVSKLEGNRFYFWRVRATNAIGTSNWSAIWRFKTIDVTAVAEAPGIPARYELYQNYPNPFNPLTMIPFDLPYNGRVVLKVYDVLGREVTILADQLMAPGHYEFLFDGHHLPSGVYYYRLEVEGRILTKRMMLVK